MKFRSIIGLTLALLFVLVPANAQNRTSFGGRYNAMDFAYGVTGNVPPLTLLTGNTSTGSASVMASACCRSCTSPSTSPTSRNGSWRHPNRSPMLPPIRIVGYVFLMNGCEQVPEELWRKNILGDGTNSPSKTEMVIDAVGSQNGKYIPLQGTWVERSNHLLGERPEGGNIAFEDGHSEWRNFNLMKHRIYGDVVWDF